MKPFKVADIVRITKGNLLCGDQEIKCENYSKDTREIKENDVYIGIKGDKFDGNSFYLEAFNKGAAVCLLDEDYQTKIQLEKVAGKTIIVVADTILAIQQLAQVHREKYDIPVVAITGSVGKTCTKDMIARVLSKKYKVLKTEGSLNNHIGLPLTILGLKDHTAMVLEIGMNHLGEISMLSTIAKPTIGVITNVAMAHIGILGSMENILKAKLEILDGMDKKGILIINNDSELLHEAKIEKTRVITCGIEKQSDIMAKDIVGAKFKVEYGETKYNMEAPIATHGFIYNSLLALAVCKELGVSPADVQEGILNFDLSKNRMEIIKDKYTIINDTYNANYDSMVNAIQYLKQAQGNKKVAILGDMLELGTFAITIHENLGKYVAESKIDYLVAVGDLAKHIADGAIEGGMAKEKIKYFVTKEESYSFLKELIKEDDVVLVKASNSMKFYEIVQHLNK